MKIDVHEPKEMPPLITQVLPFATVAPINSEGYADYLWEGVNGEQQAERKTWMDLLGGTGSVEVQLRKQREAHPTVRLMLIVEGIATPEYNGTVVWTQRPGRSGKPSWQRGKHFKLPIQAVYAFLYQVEKYIEVYHTVDHLTTARLLTTMYKADQEDEHDTFHRYLRQIDFHPNPQVEMMMNMSRKVGIGAVRAQALIKEFGTVWNVLHATVGRLAQVDGMGRDTAAMMLRKVGRTDV